MIKKLAPLALALSALVAALSACGDDDDDERLTEEEYLSEVDAIQADVGPAFDEAFSAETAREGLEGISEVADQVQQDLDDLEPPEDLEDLHDRYVDSVGEFSDFAEEQADEVDEDAPASELEGIVFGEESPLPDITEVECELVGIAEERGVELENLFCDQAEGPEAAGDNPVGVEATEFEFNIDGEFSADSTGLVLTNAGEQPHEAFISKIPEDLDLEEALASEETPEGVVDIGGTFAEPGGEAGLGFEEPLEPGRYIMVCFVPDEETGEPHALLGMVEEFTVE